VPDLEAVKKQAFAPIPDEEAVKKEVIDSARNGMKLYPWPYGQTELGQEWAMIRFHLNITLPAHALDDNREMEFELGKTFEALLGFLAEPLNYSDAIKTFAEFYRENIGVGAGYRGLAVNLATELTRAARPDLAPEAWYECMRATAAAAGVEWPQDQVGLGPVSELVAQAFADYKEHDAAGAIAHGIYYLIKGVQADAKAC